MPRGLRLGRIEQIAALVLGLFLLIAARLFVIQVLRHHEYRSHQIRQVDSKRDVPARRGRILDRNGHVLAFDVVAYDVSILKSRVRRRDLDAVAAALGRSRDEIVRALRDGGRFVTLAHRVTLSRLTAKRLASIPGVCLKVRSFRQYPFGTLAAQYIGFTDVQGRGVEGIEKAFDVALRGTPGQTILLRDENGAPIATRSSRDPEDGADVVLALDVDVQRIVDDELQRAVAETGAHGGSILVLDPYTGAILACASAPAPARRGIDYDPDVWRNRAVYDLFEPGSTLKPITVAAAIRRGIVTPATRIYAERGAKRFGRATVIRDAHREGDGWLTVSEAFARSSNICFAKMARALSSDQLYEDLRSFGLGNRSGVDLVGEPRSQLALPRDWSGRTRLTLGYGQETSLTALQLAGLYTSIANGGTLIRPRVALRRIEPGGDVVDFAAQDVRRVLSEELASTLRGLCALTVREGTGKRAHVDGVRVAGKTGTAEKAEGGRYVNRYVASFGGFAPVESPRLTCLVVLDEPQGRYHWGSQSAAPAFQRVIDAIARSTSYLGPAPERVRVVRAKDLQPENSGLASPLRLATLGGGRSLPDLRGLSLRAASRWLRQLGARAQVEGAGVVRSQWPAPGMRIADGDVVRLRCQPARAPDRRASVWPQ
jgi:cell division protein FtsI/penicillin-binding protein 2